jgi:hypothetical protein
MVFDICEHMVFNPHMSTKNDTELIESLGGSTKVAEMLGLPKFGGAQRVNNWKTRGIPALVKVQRPDLFMREAIAAAQQSGARLVGPELATDDKTTTL